MASGQTLDGFGFAGSTPPSTNYMTLDTRNGHEVCDADAATEESLAWERSLARNYAGGGITVTIIWLASSAITGDVVFGVSFERHDDEGLDLDADSYATEQTVTATAPGTSGMVQYTDLAITDGANLDGLLIGEHYRVKVARKAAAVGDTMAGDAEIIAVNLRET